VPGVGIEKEGRLKRIGIHKVQSTPPAPLKIEVLLVNLFQSHVGELHQLKGGVGGEWQFYQNRRVILRVGLLKPVCLEENDHPIAERLLFPQFSALIDVKVVIRSLTSSKERISVSKVRVVAMLFFFSTGTIPSEDPL